MTRYTYTDISKSLDDIVCMASEFFIMEESVIWGRCRIRRHVRARQVVWKLAIEHGHCFSSLGRKFNRDHSTIIHGVGLIEGECERDPEFASRVDRLRNMVKAAAPMVRERRKQIVSVPAGTSSVAMRALYDHMDTYLTERGEVQDVVAINRKFVHALRTAQAA